MLNKYKENMMSPVDRLEKRNFLLTLIAILGAGAGITYKKSMKYGFILADVLLIVDTITELIINIRNKKGKVYQ